jgi:hypothetical protein
MGYSLGAFHALFIAAAEREGSPLVSFDRYVTVDAPIQLLTGMRKIDAYYNGLIAIPPAEREARVQDLLWRTIEIAEQEDERTSDYSRSTLAQQRRGRFRPRGALPFSEVDPPARQTVRYEATRPSGSRPSFARHKIPASFTYPRPR